MEKKYQIFISSTYIDLVEARVKVRDAILSMLHFPVGMEMFNAADEEQWEIIQETIDSSDYYVLILGQRYGSEISDGPDAGISYTEKEFRYAREQKIPTLVFIIDDSVPLKKEFIETDPEKQAKLDAFKEEAKQNRLVKWWKMRRNWHVWSWERFIRNLGARSVQDGFVVIALIWKPVMRKHWH